MAKTLVLGTDPEKSWRLPDDINVELVQQLLKTAMTEGSVVEVRVLLGFGLDATVLINGKCIEAAAAYEVRPGQG